MHRCPSHVLLWKGYMYVRMYVCTYVLYSTYMLTWCTTSISVMLFAPLSHSPHTSLWHYLPIFFHLSFSLCLSPFLLLCMHLPPSSTNPCAQSEVEPTQTFTVSIADCPVGNVLMRVENGSVYQTCRCVAGGDSPILQCDLDRDILVLKVGDCVCRTGWVGT